MRKQYNKLENRVIELPIFTNTFRKKQENSK